MTIQIARGRMEGSVLFNDTLNTFIYGSNASDMW